MEGRRLILNPGPDEIAIPSGEAGYADGVLWLYLPGVTLAQAFALLSDPDHTAVIVFQYGEMSDRFEGMTRLTGIREADGMTRASLTREVD